MPLMILAAAAALTTCPALKIHDGDTIRCGAERIRISNIDAPELRGSPSCRGWKKRTHWCDYAAGIRSRDALKVFLARGPVRVQRSGHDKYGRTLATVSVNGRDAGAYLVGRGLARWWQ
ncbi:thermonuclease family protein [Novosphingobium sp. 9]|uniref:thermonuclease family protein n=1 Tax=Novosphingobium sp. 9 TaxID=2025349 RepID=UPI0021B612DC|nr:thermonuclease family protein [Novosphingobium sp. 9]